MEESLERIANVTAAAAEALQHAVEKHGDAAGDLVLLAARLEAIQKTAIGLFFLSLILLLFLWIVPKINEALKQEGGARLLPYLFAGMVSICLSLPLFKKPKPALYSRYLLP